MLNLAGCTARSRGYLSTLLFLPFLSVAPFLFEYTTILVPHLKSVSHSFIMPALEPEQEAQPDFSTHPDYQQLFEAVMTGGQSREQATLLLADLWRKMTDNNASQQRAASPPVEPQQNRGNQEVQQGLDNHDDPEHPNQAQPPQEPLQPFQPPLPGHKLQPGDQHRNPLQKQMPHPPQHGDLVAPQDLPPLSSHDQDWVSPDKADKRAPQLPPVDLDAVSPTISLRRPMAYVIEKVRKFEYVPLWYFTDQGCQIADIEKAANEDLWDGARTRDSRLSLLTAASNLLNVNALSDEQLTWEQFMDANHLLCRWLIPAGWPEGYAKVLSSFFWQIENHEDRTIVDGKEALLLYQATARRAWHDELKAGYFFDLAEIDEKKLNAYHREVNAKHNALVHKAVSV